ncbi:head-tail connector protein [Stutzerimonas stutzeri]|uniref:head-tail connector protein n=1 Tax=Stutzerimonas stutzeri TaxID=316 RepID=UPI0015E3AC41|nr:head-tail connector protein [Stutzerimonas stutzeri]MBA1227835.1 phage gp6-like head-tail connector protein [Stutzerimonas stutzeri]MDH0082764.1 head-tail connector protein [Stutzerimonas stutzeri]
MPAPTLDDLKLHLRIRHGHEDADLQLKLDAAIEQASQFLNRPIPWLATVQPEVGEPVFAPVPASVRAAILIGAAELYANREAAVVGTIYTRMPTWQNLLYPYRINLGV